MSGRSERWGFGWRLFRKPQDAPRGDRSCSYLRGLTVEPLEQRRLLSVGASALAEDLGQTLSYAASDAEAEETTEATVLMAAPQTTGDDVSMDVPAETKGSVDGSAKSYPGLSEVTASVEVSGNTRTVHYEVFDPALGRLKSGTTRYYGWFIYDLTVADGLVAWRASKSGSYDDEVGYTIYDPGAGSLEVQRH